MAALIVYLLNTAGTSPDWFGRVQDNGSAPAGALSAFGWTVAKVALTTPYWRGRIGATARATAATAGSYVDAAAGPTKGTGTGATTAGDSFRSDGALTGTFAAGNWSFTFGMRTGAASNSGRIRFNMWAATNIDGTGSPRKLNSSTLIGTAVTMNATGTTFNSTVTWAAPQVVLTNEYVFLQPEWQSTVVGTSNSCTAQFYQASFTTTDWFYTFGASNLVAPTPSFGTPTAVHVVNLGAAVNLTAPAPVLGTPTYTLVHTLSAAAFTAPAPSLGTPPVTQIHVLDAAGFTAPAPTLDTPTLTEVGGAGTWVTVWEPPDERNVNPGWVGYTIVGVIPLAELSQTGGAQARVTFQTPWSGEPSEYSEVWIGNGGGGDPYDFGDTPVQVKVGGNGTINCPVDGSAVGVVSDIFTFTKDASNSLVVAVQFSNGSADNLVYRPAGGVYSGYYTGALQAGLVNKSGYTSFAGLGALQKIELFIGGAAGEDDLTAADFITAASVLATATLNQTHVVAGSAYTTPAPVLATSTVTQKHIVAATDYVSPTPVIATSALTQQHVIGANGFTIPAPVFVAPSIITAGVDDLTAAVLTSPAPVLAASVLTQSHVLVAPDLITPAPVLGLGSLSSLHILVGAALVPSAAELGTPVLTQPIYLRPDGDSVLDGWTDHADGTSSIYLSLDEASSSDADFVQSPSAAGPNADLIVRLFDGSTQIAEWQHLDATTAFADAEQTLTTPQYEAITSFTSLFVEFDDNAGNVYRFSVGNPLASIDPPIKVRYRYKKLAT